MAKLDEFWNTHVYQEGNQPADYMANLGVVYDKIKC